MPRLDWEDVLSFCDRLTIEARERGWAVVDFEFEPRVPMPDEDDTPHFGVQLWFDHQVEELDEFAHLAFAAPTAMEPSVSAIAMLGKMVADRLDFLLREKKGTRSAPAPSASSAILAPGQQPKPKDNVIQLVRAQHLPRGRR